MNYKFNLGDSLYLGSSFRANDYGIVFRANDYGIVVGRYKEFKTNKACYVIECLGYGLLVKKQGEDFLELSKRYETKS